MLYKLGGSKPTGGCIAYIELAEGEGETNEKEDLICQLNINLIRLIKKAAKRYDIFPRLFKYG